MQRFPTIEEIRTRMAKVVAETPSAYRVLPILVGVTWNTIDSFVKGRPMLNYHSAVKMLEFLEDHEKK